MEEIASPHVIGQTPRIDNVNGEESHLDPNYRSSSDSPRFVPRRGIARTRSTPILLRGFGLCAAPPTTSPSSLMPARTSSSALDKYSPTALEDLIVENLSSRIPLRCCVACS